MAAFEKLFVDSNSLTFGGMQMFGRRQICMSFPTDGITAGTLKTILEYAFEIHIKNVEEIQYLYD